LKESREAAGLTQEEAGRRLGKSQPWMHRIEAGTRKVQAADMRELLELYDPAQELRDRLELLTTPGAAPAGFSPNVAFLEMKRRAPEAVEILLLQSERLAMELQADQYTLLQYQKAGDPISQDDLLVEKRARERVITGDNPPYYRAILSESSLWRMPGGSAALIKQQAEHLLMLIETYPRFSLQVLHKEADIPFMDADLTVLKFERRSKNMVYIPYGLDGRLLKDKEKVEERENYWSDVQGAALDVEKSRKFIHELTR
jgi:transcriptional regulator with XRE-family HTH domain